MAAGSPAARAVASTLLGAMISSHDSDIARQCLPRVWATLQLPKDGRPPPPPLVLGGHAASLTSYLSDAPCVSSRA